MVTALVTALCAQTPYCLILTVPVCLCLVIVDLQSVVSGADETNHQSHLDVTSMSEAAAWSPSINTQKHERKSKQNTVVMCIARGLPRSAF